MRVTSKTFLEYTKVAPMCDTTDVYGGVVSGWQKCFPMATHLTMVGNCAKAIHLPNLKVLTAAEQYGEYPKSVLAKPNRFEKVVLEGIQSDLDDEMMGLLSGIPVVLLKRVDNLRQLTGDGIRRLSGVRELEIASFMSPFHHMRSISELTSLRKLTLCSFNELTDETFSILKSLTLEEFTIDGRGSEDSPLTDQAFIDMKGIPKLELTCTECDFLSNISQEAFKILGGKITFSTLTFSKKFSKKNGMKFNRTPGYWKGFDNSASAWEALHAGHPVFF